MRTKIPDTAGYIVQLEKYGGLELGFFQEYEDGVLCQGDAITLFPSYERARSAMRRTIRRYNSHITPDGKRWNHAETIGRLKIKRVLCFYR